MKLLKYLIGAIALLVVAALMFVLIAEERQVLADMTSPAGDWRVEVIGTNKLIGGVEVVAHIHTSDGRMTSRGVIDLLPDWETAADKYREAPGRSFIQETEARLGDEQSGTKISKADYVR